MEKRKPVQMSVSSIKTFKEIARQFEVGDREMFLVELFDRLAEKRDELIKMLKKYA